MRQTPQTIHHTVEAITATLKAKTVFTISSPQSALHLSEQKNNNKS